MEILGWMYLLEIRFRIITAINEIEQFLKENNLGTVVKDSINSDVYISQDGAQYTLNATNDLVEFAT